MSVRITGLAPGKHGFHLVSVSLIYYFIIRLAVKCVIDFAFSFSFVLGVIVA